ncbi:MAG TPA: FtsX-like permease family protein [Candidatus Limnocylindrales bacterium]|nr:FtsX-like permease family protein [Candidatus Limnocylindrales bacterium]
MLEGLLAPLRVVLQRSVADWLIVAATWLVIVCATTLLAIGVLYGDAVALSGLRQTLAAQPAAATSIDVQMRVEPGELTTVDAAVSQHSRRILGWTDGELARTIRSGSYDLAGAVPDASETDVAVFAAADRLVDHATIVDGAWPESGAEPLEVAISTGAANALGLAVGDELSLTSRAGEDRVVEVRIAGTWRPDDPGERYWLGDELELSGVSAGPSFTVHGPLVVTGADLVDRVATGDLDVSWRTLPNFDNLALENVRWLRSDTVALERRIRSELGDAAFFSVTTGLPQVLQDADRSLLVSRSGVLLLTIQFVILAAYALVLVAGLLVEQRRIETAMLRSRGASAGHVAWMALLEGLVLVVPAALAAPWVALGALRAFDAVGPLADAGVSIQPRVDAAAFIVAGIAGLACLVGLVVPAFASGRGLAAVRQTLGRQGNRTLAQRLGIDLALVVLAGIGLWQLRQYGAPLTATVRGSVGLDPLLVAAPAIGLLAGAILALRVIPLLAELAERLLGTRRGLVAPLGARQLARRPLRYTRSALLLMLAAALGTFAAAYTTTWARSQADQAAYQSGGDLRVEVSSFPDLPLWAFGSAYGALDGVEATTPVVIDSFDVSGTAAGGQLLALDTGGLAEVVDVRSDLLGGRDLSQLADDLAPDMAGFAPIPLPGTPAAVMIGIDTGLQNFPTEDAEGSITYFGPLPETLLIGRVSVALRDAAGLVHVVESTAQLQAAVTGQQVEVMLTDALPAGGAVTPEYPIDLIGIQLLLQPPADTRIAGNVEVTSVAIADAAGAPTDLDLVPSRDGWSWLLERGLDPAEAAPSAGDADAVVFSEERPIYGDDGPLELRLVPDSLAEVAGRALPIAVSRSFADATQAEVGDPVAIGTLTRRTEVEIAAIVDAFPTLEPDRPFALLDVGGYALSTYARNGEDVFADEWWLSVSDEPGVVAALAEEPYSVETLVSRSNRAATLTDDPVALGVIGALAIGSIAALIVAIIGFVVSAVVSTRERLGEFALLRALGLSPGQLSAWLTLENAFLLTAGVVAGTGLGLVLSWLVLPFVTLTADARTVVPPVLVEIPWLAIGIVHLLAAAALVATVVVIGGILRRVPVSGVLRAGQD